MPTVQLNKDSAMLTRMEQDLQAKCKEAFDEYSVKGKIYGVFSLDDMENKRKSELANLVGVGVGYLGCGARETSQLNPDTRTRPRQMVDFQFVVLLVVPSGKECIERATGMELLSVLRLGINGTTVDGVEGQRSWEFVDERPNISESEPELLYYSQVWRLALTNTGKLS